MRAWRMTVLTMATLVASVTLPGSALATGTGTASVDASIGGSSFPYGTAVSAGAIVSAAPGDPTPVGAVAYYVCTTKPCTTSGIHETTQGLNNGANSFYVAGLAVGSYCLLVTYTGDTNYAPAQSSGNDCFTVPQGPPHFANMPNASDQVVGTSVTDQAILYATGGDIETGSVTFSGCGPLASATGCTNGTTSLGTQTLNSGANATSDGFTTTASGWYCFEVSYGGDGNYTAATDSSKSNCFQARYPDTVTQLAESGTTYGSGTRDTIDVKGSNGQPGGTVNFFACGPLASASGCATGGTGLGSSAVYTYALGDSQAVVDTTPAAGIWCYRAEYSGDSTYIDSVDSSTDGCFVVNKADTTTGTTAPAGITLGGSTTETATVNGVSGGVDPTGNVTFFACGPNPSGCATGGTQIGAVKSLTGSTKPTSTATSDQFTASAAGQWCIRAEYGGDNNYNTSDNGQAQSSTMCFTVSQAQSQSSAAPHDNQITLGQSTTDKTTVTGVSGELPPSGKITFSACGPTAADCSGGGTQVGSPVSLVSIANSDTATATTAAFTPTAAGSWCFRADYPGDTNYLSSTDGSGKDQCFTVGKATPSIAAPTQSPTTTLAGSDTATATVTGNGTGGSPTGAVTFSVCGPTASSCAAGGTPLGSEALAAAASNAATASSPAFTPTAPGTWCFRADYAGDANYTSTSAGSSTQCFAVPKPNAPSVTITAPAPGNVFVVGQTATAGYRCADSAGATGIASCTGPVASGAPIDTSVSALGFHRFTVTATSNDGESATTSVPYRVIRPPNQARVSDITTKPDGTVSFTIYVPNPGAVDVMTTSWSNNFAHTAYTLQPAPHRFVFGRKHVVVPRQGTYRITTAPDAQGVRLIAHHRYKIHIRLWVSYTPTNGRQLNVGFYRIPISR